MRRRCATLANAFETFADAHRMRRKEARRDDTRSS